MDITNMFLSVISAQANLERNGLLLRKPSDCTEKVCLSNSFNENMPNV